MRNFIANSNVITPELVCDCCGIKVDKHNGEFKEFFSMSHSCGDSSIIGDGKLVSLDLCQHCFDGMCSDIVNIREHL